MRPAPAVRLRRQEEEDLEQVGEPRREPTNGHLRAELESEASEASNFAPGPEEDPAGSGPANELGANSNQLVPGPSSASASSTSGGSSRLHIVRPFAPEAVQNGTQNVTIGE